MLVLRSMQEHDLGRQQLGPTGMMRRDKVFLTLALNLAAHFNPRRQNLLRRRRSLTRSTG